MRPLTFTDLFYDPARLAEWKRGDYRLLQGSAAAQVIKDELIARARTRMAGRRQRGKQAGDRRFFGEAFVAAKLDHAAGWYSSFKWFTAKRWLAEGGAGTDSSFRSGFSAALQHPFGRNALTRLQEAAEILRAELDGRIPVAPDLWLSDGASHRFVEAKLPGDRLGDCQLAGFALLATSLDVPARVSLEVVELHPEGTAPKRRHQQAAREQFDAFCSRLRRGSA
jgi:hypothetical protein